MGRAFRQISCAAQKAQTRPAPEALGASLRTRRVHSEPLCEDEVASHHRAVLLAQVGLLVAKVGLAAPRRRRQLLAVAAAEAVRGEGLEDELFSVREVTMGLQAVANLRVVDELLQFARGSTRGARERGRIGDAIDATARDAKLGGRKGADAGGRHEPFA